VFVAVPVGVGVETLVAVGDGDGVGVLLGTTVAVGVAVPGLPLPFAESARNISRYALKGSSDLIDWARTIDVRGSSDEITRSLGMRTDCPNLLPSKKSWSATSEAGSADEVVALSAIAPPPRSKPAISTRNGIGLFTSAPRC